MRGGRPKKKSLAHNQRERKKATRLLHCVDFFFIPSLLPSPSLSPYLSLRACLPLLSRLHGLLQRQQAPARGRRRSQLGAEQDAAFVVRDRCKRRGRALLGGLCGAKVRLGGRGEGRAGENTAPELGREESVTTRAKPFFSFESKSERASAKERPPPASAASSSFRASRSPVVRPVLPYSLC